MANRLGETESWTKNGIALTGTHIALEPLSLRHLEGLVAAASRDPSLYRWSFVPTTERVAMQYIETAVSWREAGTAVAFAIVRRQDGAILGSTRFFDIERWAWPKGHTRHGRSAPDVCEIGYTWLTASALRTAANTEAKFLMLRHAFESWGVLRVCLTADARNLRSRAAIERIGARFEGMLRSHRMAADFTSRDSARYSILDSEWPEVRRGLSLSMARS